MSLKASRQGGFHCLLFFSDEYAVRELSPGYWIFFRFGITVWAMENMEIQTGRTGCDPQCRYGRNCIHNIPLFSSLGHDAIMSLTAVMTHRKWKKGDIILREGAQATGFTIIREGIAKAFKTTAEGREQILYIFPKNDYFGARFLFTDGIAPYTVMALEDTVTCALDTKNFRSLLAAQPEVSLQVINALAGRMRRLELILLNVGGRNSAIRIASMLLELSESYGVRTPNGVELELPLSREGWANHLGLARETLSRKMTQLEEMGIIVQYPGKKLLIKDMGSLREYVETGE